MRCSTRGDHPRAHWPAVLRSVEQWEISFDPYDLRPFLETERREESRYDSVDGVLVFLVGIADDCDHTGFIGALCALKQTVE